MNSRGLLFYGFWMINGILHAQSDFRPGYIINLDGDTIHGTIDYRGDHLMGEICRFDAADSDGIIIYSPQDLIAYRLDDGKYYVSKEVNSRSVFLEFLIEGKMNVYYLRDKRGEHYFVEKEGTGIAELPYEEAIRYKDDKPYAFHTRNHIGLLRYYMQDAPAMQSRIANMGKPSHDNLTKLAKDYHNIVCKDESCVIYVKKEPFVKVNLEIIGGIGHYPVYSKSSLFIQPGILTNIWMPRVNEKFYFRAGMLYSNFESDDVFKIPLMVEYVYPKGTVTPKLAYGITIYRVSGEFFTIIAHSVAFMGGINIKLWESLCLVINYDLDFNPMVISILPRSILSQSVSAGIIFKL